MREVTISNDLARAILAGLEMLARRIRNEDTSIESPVIRDVNYCRERLADAITQGEFEDAKRTEHDNAESEETERKLRGYFGIKCGFTPCVLDSGHYGDHIFSVRGPDGFGVDRGPS